MNEFKVTKEKKMFLNGVELEHVSALNINIRPQEKPTVTLVLSPDSVDVDEYLNTCDFRPEKTVAHTCGDRCGRIELIDKIRECNTPPLLVSFS